MEYFEICRFQGNRCLVFSGKIQMWSKKSPNLKTSDPSPSPQNYDVILKNSEIFNLEKICEIKCNVPYNY